MGIGAVEMRGRIGQRLGEGWGCVYAHTHTDIDTDGDGQTYSYGHTHIQTNAEPHSRLK